MQRQSHILIFVALGLVALVAGGAWWVTAAEQEPTSPVQLESIEPEPEPEALAEADEVTGDDELPSTTGARESVSIETVSDENTPAVEAAHREQLTGQLLDAATSEPLPEYAFELVDVRNQRQRLSTDAEGRFDATLHAGPLRARFLEMPRGPILEVGEVRFDAKGAAPAPLVLRVESGPTYRLSLAPRGMFTLEDLRSSLRMRGPEGALVGSGRVHDAPTPWVRIGPLAADADPAAQLTIESRDGVWRGTTTVSFGPGVRPGIASLTLEALGALEVRVLDPDGKPVADANVVLGFDDGRSLLRRTQAEGLARFEFITASRATLKVNAARFLDHDQPVDLISGQVSKKEAWIARAPSLGAIRGVVRSDSGRYRERVAVRLAPLDRPDGPPPISAQIVWSQDAPTTGSFTIEDVPAGRWNLSVVEDDWFEWEPRHADVEAPLVGFELRVHDAVPVADLVFQPHTLGGAPFDAPYNLRVSSGGSTDVQRATGVSAVVPSFPADQPLRWRVDATGCAPAVGDGTAFVVGSSSDGREQRVARPVLEPGWGELYRVTRSDNRRAVEGATVLVDGREMGKTDKDGRVYVRAAAKPSSVTFRFRDWKLEKKVDLSQRGGSRDIERSVRLQPPKPKAKK